MIEERFADKVGLPAMRTLPGEETAILDLLLEFGVVAYIDAADKFNSVCIAAIAAYFIKRSGIHRKCFNFIRYKDKLFFMEKTWRWFGPSDIIPLKDLRQIGVEGIVTALHDVPNGQIWSEEAIRERRELIESHGMRWSVVESLPVSESIKYAGSDRDALIDNYIESLANLGRCGIRTVCYNFMPVIDWVRTELEYKLEDGSSSLYFSRVAYAYFDAYVLGRKEALEEYDEQTRMQIQKFADEISEEERQKLIDTIIVKTQGFISGNVADGEISPVEHFKQLMSRYEGLTRQDLRENLKYFLERIMPVCREYDINMCIHPDDPPMPVFGLPRIAGCAEDIRWILEAVNDVHNGLTFCAGSLSAGEHNDVLAMAREFAPRTHFVHIRTCNLLDGGDFMEAPHIGGRVNLVELVRIFERQGRSLPMRVDHGRTILDDEKLAYNPGYSFHGRMLAFAQVEGMMAAVKDEIKNLMI